MSEYEQVICPECWNEQQEDMDNDEFICEACGWQFGIDESVH